MQIQIGFPEDFWSVMVKDSSLWWDGWYWRVVGTEVGRSRPRRPRLPRRVDAPTGVVASNGPTSINCIGCHASADYNVPRNRNLLPPDDSLDHTTRRGFLLSGAARRPDRYLLMRCFRPSRWPRCHLQTQADPNPAAGFTDRLPSSIFANVRTLPAATPRYRAWCPSHQDFFYSKPASAGGPSLFVTSNQCASCHDATDNAPMPTHMLYPPLSPTNRPRPTCRPMANGAIR